MKCTVLNNSRDPNLLLRNTMKLVNKEVPLPVKRKTSEPTVSIN